MPFIERQDRTDRVEFKEKIRPEVVDLVEKYARFVESERWYVVQELLRKTIGNDKDFQLWLKKQQGESDPAALPAKKVKAIA